MSLISARRPDFGFKLAAPTDCTLQANPQARLVFCGVMFAGNCRVRPDSRDRVFGPSTATRNSIPRTCDIRAELDGRLAELNAAGKLQEAQRLSQRTLSNLDHIGARAIAYAARSRPSRGTRAPTAPVDAKGLLGRFLMHIPDRRRLCTRQETTTGEPVIPRRRRRIVSDLPLKPRCDQLAVIFLPAAEAQRRQFAVAGERAIMFTDRRLTPPGPGRSRRCFSRAVVVLPSTGWRAHQRLLS